MMRTSTGYWKLSLRTGAAAALAICLWIPAGSLAWAQGTTAEPQQGAQSDGDIQSQVANALARDPALQNQQVRAYTSNGIVTLTGTVQTEQQRQEAETVAAGVPGVSGIENDLNVTETANQGQNPPPPPATSQPEQVPPPPDAEQVPSPPDAGQVPSPPDAGQAPAPASPEQVPPPPPPDQVTPQAQYPQQGGSGQYPGQPGYNSPVSGPVTIPAGTLLQVRTSDALDLSQLQDGASFQGTAASDVFEGNVLAIPRGAVVEGTVVHVKKPGALGGAGELQLQVTAVDLGGRAYPVNTDIWSSQSRSKTGYTATNTVGGALLGALIGGLLGRGPGVAAGALVGGVGGMAASAATHGPGQGLPAETLLNFHLTRAASVQPVSWQEAQQLAQNAPRLQRRTVYMTPYPYPYAYSYPYPYYPYRMYYGW